MSSPYLRKDALRVAVAAVDALDRAIRVAEEAGFDPHLLAIAREAAGLHLDQVRARVDALDWNVSPISRPRPAASGGATAPPPWSPSARCSEPWLS